MQQNPSASNLVAWDPNAPSFLAAVTENPRRAVLISSCCSSEVWFPGQPRCWVNAGRPIHQFCGCHSMAIFESCNKTRLMNLTSVALTFQWGRLCSPGSTPPSFLSLSHFVSRARSFLLPGIPEESWVKGRCSVQEKTNHSDFFSSSMTNGDFRGKQALTPMLVGEEIFL
jgi:hypothetical protein